ncbi:hypothetical protein AtEden1_Chr5g0117821 [Arabidopsis thaliana]
MLLCLSLRLCFAYVALCLLCFGCRKLGSRFGLKDLRIEGRITVSHHHITFVMNV